MQIRTLKTALAVCAIGLLGVSANAATIDTSAATVTGSGFYNAGGETFPFANVIDGRLNDTGSPSNWSFWLTRNATLDYFVVDLNDVYTIESIHLQNTHNRGFNDRSTADFRVSSSLNGTSFTPRVTGTLQAVFRIGFPLRVVRPRRLHRPLCHV